MLEVLKLKLATTLTPKKLIIHGLSIECDLRAQIKEAQGHDQYLQDHKDQDDFSFSEDGVFMYQGRVCVP